MKASTCQAPAAWNASQQTTRSRFPTRAAPYRQQTLTIDDIPQPSISRAISIMRHVARNDASQVNGFSCESGIERELADADNRFASLAASSLWHLPRSHRRSNRMLSSYKAERARFYRQRYENVEDVRCARCHNYSQRIYDVSVPGTFTYCAREQQWMCSMCRNIVELPSDADERRVGVRVLPVNRLYSEQLAEVVTTKEATVVEMDVSMYRHNGIDRRRPLLSRIVPCPVYRLADVAPLILRASPTP